MLNVCYFINKSTNSLFVFLFDLNGKKRTSSIEYLFAFFAFCLLVLFLKFLNNSILDGDDDDDDDCIHCTIYNSHVTISDG